MPIKSAMEAARANENPCIDPRSPLRRALDELSQALVEAELSVGGLGGVLEPALSAETDTLKGFQRPPHSSPLLEEVQQLTDRVCSLTDRVRDLSGRCIL